MGIQFYILNCLWVDVSCLCNELSQIQPEPHMYFIWASQFIQYMTIVTEPHNYNKLFVKYYKCLF